VNKAIDALVASGRPVEVSRLRDAEVDLGDL